MRALSLLLITLLGWALCSSSPAPVQSTVTHIVLDPGHGGKDPGAVGTLAYEKDVVLDVSLRVRKLLRNKQPNLQVSMTRDDDTFIGLLERAEFANKNKADLFISVHANANRSQSPYGSETYAMGLHKNDDHLDVVMKENSSILLEEDYKEKYGGFDPKSEESYIMFSLMQHAFLKQSLTYARMVENQMVKVAKRKSRGVKQAGFLVLWKTSMPAALLEIGFMSNPTEQKFLVSEQGKDHVARAIYNSILDYRNN